jgi:hypothetical protein
MISPSAALQSSRWAIGDLTGSISTNIEHGGGFNHSFHANPD